MDKLTDPNYKTSDKRGYNIAWDLIRHVVRHGSSDMIPHFTQSFINWKNDCVEAAKGRECPCDLVMSKWGDIITEEHWKKVAESDLPNAIKQWLYESLKAVKDCHGTGQAAKGEKKGKNGI